jgi:predicted TIM-barrel fold metal-dependent hydrolase
MMAVIDADAHVIENDQTWAFLGDSESQFKPPVVAEVDGSGREFWIIDGKLRAKGFANVGAETPKASRELTDVAARLRHMDELGTDIQVIYPSMLTHMTDRPDLEVALSKSYNRSLGEVWRQSNNRLRWVARLPLLSMDVALEELQSATENGCCGVFIRSIEGDRLLTDRYFFPLYEEASRLNVPVCVHASIGNASMEALLSQDRDQGNFSKFKLSVISAFHSIVVDAIPDLFPHLRFGFIEVSSQWVPYVAHDLARRFEWKGRNLAHNLLRDNRLYVACQMDDDLPHVLSYAGEDNLVIGTDYGHADTSSELRALQALRQRDDLEPRVIEKLLDANPRALYGL